MVAAFLGNETGKLSASLEPARAERRKRQRSRREAAWTIRSLNQSLMPGTQWADCGNPVGRYVAIKELADSGGVMQPSSIATCKSPWACLSCAAKIRSLRAREIDHICKAHLAAGGGITFITLTFPHGLGDSLADSLKTVVKGWKSLISGAGYKGKKQKDGTYTGGAKNRWGILGNLRAVEITDGIAHGWHPHLHVLCFHDQPLSPEDGSMQEFRAWWSNRWARWIKRTLKRDVHNERGVDAVPVRDNEGIGEYVSKIHYELVRSDLKHGRRRTNRTPWQIAIDAADTGDCRDMARWVEYCQATKGKWVVTGLDTMRKIYPTPEADITDEEAAAEEQDGTLAVLVDGSLWRAARRQTRIPTVAMALSALESDGIDGMTRVLAQVIPDRGATVRQTADGIPLICFERNGGVGT